MYNKDTKSVKNIAEKLIKRQFIARLPLPDRYKKRVAFTLAEVLITLLIISVVASLVIPNLVQNTQDAELRIAFKKTYSILDTTTKRIVLDNSGTIKDICPKVGWQQDAKCLMNLFKPYLSYTKSCTSDAIGEGCWHQQYATKYLSGITYVVPIVYYGMALNDGTLLFFHYGSGDCSNSNHCVLILVDVNGFKPPNTWGKDIFRIFVNSNMLEVQNGIDCRPGAGGETCASKVLKGEDY